MYRKISLPRACALFQYSREILSIHIYLLWTDIDLLYRRITEVRCKGPTCFDFVCISTAPMQAEKSAPLSASDKAEVYYMDKLKKNPDDAVILKV